MPPSKNESVQFGHIHSQVPRQKSPSRGGAVMRTIPSSATVSKRSKSMA